MHQLLAEDTIIDGPLEFDGGRMAVPDRPGLGIELDRDPIDKFARAYEQFGQYSENPIHCD